MRGWIFTSRSIKHWDKISLFPAAWRKARGGVLHAQRAVKLLPVIGERLFHTFKSGFFSFGGAVMRPPAFRMQCGDIRCPVLCLEISGLVTLLQSKLTLNRRTGLVQ